MLATADRIRSHCGIQIYVRGHGNQRAGSLFIHAIASAQAALFGYLTICVFNVYASSPATEHPSTQNVTHTQHRTSGSAIIGLAEQLLSAVLRVRRPYAMLSLTPLTSGLVPRFGAGAA